MGYPGEKYEKTVFEFIKNKYDPNAIWEGGSDSTKPDIISDILGIVEVKQKETAQCGQFTESTVDNYEFSQEIIDCFSNNNTIITNDLCKQWVKNYYLNHKKVNYFGVCDKNNNVTLLTPEEFF